VTKSEIKSEVELMAAEGISMAGSMGAANEGAIAKAGGPPQLAGKFRLNELILKWIFGACAAVSVLTTFGIIYVLIADSIPFFKHANVSFADFMFGKTWSPLVADENGKFYYGVLPLISGTFLVAAGAAVFALPMGLLSAIYLSEYASPTARNILKPILEILAGVPTVVYGFFALIFITPLLQKLEPVLQQLLRNPQFTIEPLNALGAAIAMAIMVLPLVSSLCEDSLRMVPQGLREGAYALGATKMEVSLQVVMPAAISGIAASFILAISRAIGETMIVFIAAGNTPVLTANPFQGVQTMTSYISQVAMGDVPHGTVEYQSIFVVGLLLFALTVFMNIISILLVKKFQQKYD
jgi:phosphate transport system permease protein